jgi:PAS domain S-box-containing protein
MFRRLLVLSCVIVALHIAMATIFKTWAYTPLVSNSLQILASFLAAGACFAARQKGRGISRPFWLLTACGFAVWGASNFFWAYYEVALHMEPPTGSLVRFLFDLQCAFFAMAVLLEEHEKSTYSILESIADFTQLVIVFTLVYVGLYYIPSLRMNAPDALRLELQMEFGENCALVALALFQRLRSSARQTRTLFGGLALYLTVYTIGAAVAEFHENTQESPTGNLYDLCWTVPLLFGALWAIRWQPTEDPAPAAGTPPTFWQLLMNNGTYALAPVIVLVQVAGLPVEWRLMRYTLLGVSILCYAARLCVSQLRESETGAMARRQALAMESAVDGMAMMNAAGAYIYANSAFAGMVADAKPVEILGKPWKETARCAQAANMGHEIEEALRSRGKWFGACTIRLRSAAELPIELGVTQLPDGGTVWVSRDISDRRTAEMARVQAEFKYQTLVEQVAAVSYIAELGMDGQWLYVSPQVENIFGYTVEEWLAESRNWIRHIPVEDHSVIWAAEEASKNGEPFHVEYRVVRKDGKTVWVSDTAVVVGGSDGQQPLMEGIIVDITERKHHENQSQQSRRMEAVGRLAGGIAHDFNNLLTIINGYAEMALNRAGLPAGAAADVQQISGAADRAAALVRQLLAFSRRQVLQPKAIDVNDIVVGLDKLLRRLIDENIEMQTICAENLGTVKADPAQIEQVVMNLVVNARDAMPHGGRLTVETANVTLDANYAADHVPVKPGKYVMLAVSDTGVGMDAEAQTHIFEPFYTTKGAGRGTGLGLSTVYGIVKQSEGYIWVYSEVNRGTTFKLYLPCVEGGTAPDTRSSKEGAVSQGTETILLVEDEEAVRELARTVLSAQGYTILEADSPERAEVLAREHNGNIDLLLTDVVMPGTSGRELARRLTAGAPKLRVLFMSGYTDNVIAQGGVLEPGVSFLQKPFSPRALAAKVREVLDQPVAAK